MSYKNKLMLGPSLNNKGGITTVINLYKTARYLDEHYDYLVTAQDGNRARKLWLFCTFPLQLMWKLSTSPNIDTVVMQVSQRGSFVRKTLALLICKLFGKYVVFHKHGSEFVALYHTRQNRLTRWLTRWVLRQVNCIVALSESRRQELLTIEPRANVQVVYNPCLMGISSLSELHHHREKRDKKAPIQFLFMGRLGTRKGVYDLIEALHQLKQQRDNLQNEIQVSLFGDGDYKAVETMISNLRLNSVINLSTWVSGEDKHQVFLNADVLLLPSYNEGLPMSILEAMSYGMPVISTTVGGIPEAVLNEETGFLINPGDTKALQKAILTFVNKPEQIEAMGEKGWQLANQNFEVKKIVTEFEKTLTQSL